MGPGAAAAQCETEGLGSWQAIRKAWYRAKKIE
jgi:hypothetical protein